MDTIYITNEGVWGKLNLSLFRLNRSFVTVGKGMRMRVPGSGRLLNHSEDLRGLHVEHFGDPALHDEEVGIVHVQLDWSEEVADPAVLHVAPVDQILIFPTDHNLNR